MKLVTLYGVWCKYEHRRSNGNMLSVDRPPNRWHLTQGAAEMERALLMDEVEKISDKTLSDFRVAEMVFNLKRLSFACYNPLSDCTELTFRGGAGNYAIQAR